jgi:hypothetical protein
MSNEGRGAARLRSEQPPLPCRSGCSLRPRCAAGCGQLGQGEQGLRVLRVGRRSPLRSSVPVRLLVRQIEKARPGNRREEVG